MARMRTAEGVMAIIREQDPKTQVTVHAIRRLIASGKVPVTCCGRKYLVDADAMIEFIARGGEPAGTEAPAIPSAPLLAC